MDNICNVSCQYIAKTIKQKIINGMVWYFHLYSGLKYLAFSYFVPVKKSQINISKPNIMMKKIVKGSAGTWGCPYTSNTNKTSKEMPIKYIKFIPIFFAKSFVWSINIFLQQILVYHYDNQTNKGIYGRTIFPFVFGVKVWQILIPFFD